MDRLKPLFSLFRNLVLLALVCFLLSGCRQYRPVSWPPKPRWERLDPIFCHPYPCRADGTAEWPGQIDNR